jgi:hypothetical protein
MSSEVRARLETAVSSILVQLAYEQLQRVGTAALTVSVLVGYVCAEAALRVARDGFQQQLLVRCLAVFTGLLGNAFMECIAISGGGPGGGRLLAAKLSVVGCVLVFLSIVLKPVSTRFNFVGISLYVFSDSLQGLIAAEHDALVVVVVAVVVCSFVPFVSAALDARVPGLSVLSSALFMATVNWVLDLITGASGAAGGQCAMLLLVVVAMEVCKRVDSALEETQGYVIYQVSAVLAAFLRRVRVDAWVVAVCGAFAYLATQKLAARWMLAELVSQIVVLVAVGAVVREFRTAIAPLAVEIRGIALAVLIVFFEAAKAAAGG